MTAASFDFFDFAPAETTGLPDDVAPLYSCSTSGKDGGGSVAITADAVFLGEEDGVTRIDKVDIRSWTSAARGPLFALTVRCEDTHVTYLFADFRTATVSAMTRTVGPENVQLRAA